MTTTPTKRFRILTTYPSDVMEAAPLADFPQLEFVHVGRPASPRGMIALAARSLWRGDLDGILAEGGYEAFAFALFKRSSSGGTGVSSSTWSTSTGHPRAPCAA